MSANLGFFLATDMYKKTAINVVQKMEHRLAVV